MIIKCLSLILLILILTHLISINKIENLQIRKNFFLFISQKMRELQLKIVLKKKILI